MEKAVLAGIDLDLQNPLASCLTDKLEPYSVQILFELRDFQVNGFTIQNPEDSGRILILDKVFGGSTFFPDNPANLPLNYRSAVQIVISRNASLTNDPLPINNLIFGSPNNSAMRAFFLTSVGLPVSRSYQVAGFFDLNFAGRIIVLPGNTVGIHAVGGNDVDAADPTEVALTATWFELNIPLGIEALDKKGE